MGDRSFTTLYYLGISHYGDNWFYGAQENLLEAHRKNPTDINVLYYLGKSCARTSWKEEGVEYMNQALEMVVPTDSLMERLYEGLVECYKYLPKADPYKQIEVMKTLYTYNKKPSLLYNVAYIYDQTKDEANAKYFYQKYLDAAVKTGELAVDKQGNYQVSPDFTARTMMQTTAIRYLKEIREKEFFEKGTPKTNK